MDYIGKVLKGMNEIIGLLKDIKKQNDKIIKHLINIDDVNAEANGYLPIEDGDND